MTLTLACSLAIRRFLGRRHAAPEVPTMPTAVVVRPDWRAVVGARDWAPVYEEPQAIERVYAEGHEIVVRRFVPGGYSTFRYRRQRDGSRGRYLGWAWFSEPEADWPITKALLAAAG